MSKKNFKIKDHLLELFDVFKHERKGVLFFSFLIICVLAINFTMDKWVVAPEIDTHQLDSLIAEYNKPTNTNFSSNEKNTFRTIDPNSADTIDWMQLGFSKKQVISILNYRSAIGGKFKTVRQIQKIYVIDSLKFSNIQPYLSIRNGTDDSLVKKKTNSLGREVKNNQKRNQSLFDFDPNKISFDSLVLLGFYSKQASSLIKYREKIELFLTPDDLLNLYLYKEADHKKYNSHIKIDKEYANRPVKAKYDIEDALLLVELNSADTAELISVRGIGPYYASKIIQYRNALGGYYDKNQLYEIKKIPKDRMDLIISRLEINKKLIKKIRINHCEFKDLLTHPYFDYYETKLLLDYRNEHGKFIYLHDLNKIDPLPDYYIEKIGQYLIFD